MHTTRYFDGGVEPDTAVFVDAEPGIAQDQALHRDVQRWGSVALQLPLEAVSAANVPVSFCPGTHAGRAKQSQRSKLQMCALLQHVGAVPRGTALLYDSALYHRGLANVDSRRRLALYVNFKKVRFIRS